MAARKALTAMTVTTTAARCAADRTAVTELLCQRAGLPAGHPDRAVLRERSIEAALPLAHGLAARYLGRGEPFDDLYQVAAVALIVAVDRFDPAQTTTFATFAVPTIIGALKHHFRDATWQIRVPRRTQDLAVTLAATSTVLTQQLGRSPTPRELAGHLQAAEADVVAALIAWQARRPDSLDAPRPAAADQPLSLIETMGGVDARLDMVIDRRDLQQVLAALTARQRRILAMRYIDDMTQSEIAAEVGLSQMHISRLLAQMLTRLRAGMSDEPSPERGRPGTYRDRKRPPARAGARIEQLDRIGRGADSRRYAGQDPDLRP